MMVRPRIIDGNESVKMSFSVSTATREALSRLANQGGHSLAAIIREAVTNYLEEKDA